MDAQQLERVIRDADRLFFDGKPGAALALIRETRQALDLADLRAAQLAKVAA